MSEKHKPIVIVGAGVAGITLAWELVKRGREVIVIEKQDQIGGLAKTLRYGDFSFDTGPHRFYSTKPYIMDYIREVLGDELLEWDVDSAVRLFQTYYDWPLNISVILKLPIPVMLGALKDMIIREKRPGVSFEDHILNKYGRTLYRTDFKPYTEKFLKMPCSEIHSDWAKMGINRSVIDEKKKIDTIFHVIRNTLTPQKPLRVLYAKTGCNVFTWQLAERIQKGGGRILTGSNIVKLERGDAGIQRIHLQDGTAIEPGLVVWTAPIDLMARMLGLETSGLHFLTMVLYFAEIMHAPAFDYQWVYFAEEDIIFNRTSDMKHFSPHMSPPNTSALCVEVTCKANDPVEKDPSLIEEKVKADLIKVGLVKSPEAFGRIHKLVLPYTYPIYDLHYREKLSKVEKHIQQVKNVYLAGRSGLFWYNNQDNSIENALETAKVICQRIP
ncbi:MAG: FAD-dependent oxidoreductase [Lentisphaerota bacterium]